MRVDAMAGVLPVPVGSVEETERALVDLLVGLRGPESAHDPGLGLTARDAAELAHSSNAGLVALLTHPDADPAVLVGVVVAAEPPLGPGATAELRGHLESETTGIREVTESCTERGYPVLISETIVLDGCQLQAVVVEPAGRRLAVFTLHSTTGRGWLALAALLGRLVSSVDFSGNGTQVQMA